MAGRWQGKGTFVYKLTKSPSHSRVVTGLRLVKLGRVFHLQISEGTLGERGSVTPGDWVPLQKFDPSEPGMRDGVDYHKLTFERRAIDLDELDSPAGHILTGVRYVYCVENFANNIRIIGASKPYSVQVDKIIAGKLVYYLVEH